MPRKRDPGVMAIVAGNLIRLRESKGWSQEELRRRVGWKSKTMVSQLENRHTGVGPQTLGRLAEVFGVSPSEFYREMPLSESPESLKLISVSLTDLGRGEDRAHAEGQYPSSQELERLATFPLRSLVKDPSGIYPTGEKFLLPKWYSGREKHDLICATVDSLPPHPLLSIGDVICIDRDDKPVPGQTDSAAVYAVRLEKEIKISRLELREHLVTIRGLQESKDEPTQEQPIIIDLRAHPSAVIGRVVWVLKTF